MPRDIETIEELKNTIAGKDLGQLLREGVYCQVQEQGQERTWIHELEHLEKSNKDVKDEVFVGHIPRVAKACDLYDVFQNCGIIREIRLMFEFNNRNRGFCFVAFTNEEDAKKAISYHHESAVLHKSFDLICNKDRIGVNLSRKQKRLFLGGVPKERQAAEIQQFVQDALKRNSEKGVEIEVVDVIKRDDWGYCFLDFKNHREAALAKRTGIRELFTEPVTLDWAKEKGSLSDIRLSPSEEILSGLNSGDFSRRASITSIPPLSPPKDESPLGGTSSFFRQNSFPSPNSEVDAAYQSTFEMQTRRNSMPVSIARYLGNPGALATELEHSRRRLSEIEVRYDEEVSRFRSLQQARQDLQDLYGSLALTQQNVSDQKHSQIPSLF